MKKEVSGFSLVELMFTLVAISCILAVFAPVISKKIKSGGMSLTVDTLKGLKQMNVPNISVHTVPSAIKIQDALSVISHAAPVKQLMKIIVNA